MSTAGKIVLTPSGKRGVLLSGKLAVFNAAGECADCCGLCPHCLVEIPPTAIDCTFAGVTACPACFLFAGLGNIWAAKWTSAPDVNGLKTLVRTVDDSPCQYRVTDYEIGGTLDAWWGYTPSDALDHCQAEDPLYGPQEFDVTYAQYRMAWTAIGADVSIYIGIYDGAVPYTLNPFLSEDDIEAPYDCTAVYQQDNIIAEAHCDDLAAYSISHYGGSVTIEAQ